jgi:dihydropyrimidinase
VEAEATARAMSPAAVADTPIFVVHVTCQGAAPPFRTAYPAGQRAYGETCSHYLTLTVDNLAKPDFEGAKYVCSPPQRSRERLDVLWQSVSRGWLQVIGSDHCGFDWATQKHIGRDDFTEIPNGAPGVQYRMAVIWTHGVETGRITRQKFVDFSPHEGMGHRGRADKVFLRAMLTAGAGAFVVSLGQGMWVKGEPFGAAYTGDV